MAGRRVTAWKEASLIIARPVTTSAWWMDGARRDDRSTSQPPTSEVVRPGGPAAKNYPKT